MGRDGEDPVLTGVQGGENNWEKAWMGELVPEIRRLWGAHPSIASLRSILAPVFSRH